MTDNNNNPTPHGGRSPPSSTGGTARGGAGRGRGGRTGGRRSTRTRNEKPRGRNDELNKTPDLDSDHVFFGKAIRCDDRCASFIYYLKKMLPIYCLKKNVPEILHALKMKRALVKHCHKPSTVISNLGCARK